MNNNKQIYNRQHAILSDWYKYGVGHTYKRYFINKIIKYIKNIDDISSILDLGCGEGSNTYFISTKFNTDKVVGIDITEEGVKKAKLNFSNIDFLQLNLDEIELSNMQQYDLVCSFDVLEHVDDWENLLHKMTVICNKYILITVPTGRMRDYEVSIGHLRNFKKGEIENFLNNNNFRTIKTFYGGFPFYSPLGRDYLNKNHKNYEESITGDFTNKQKIFHKMLYILFRYFCFDNIGDMFTGLFIKDDITINSNGGGYIMMTVPNTNSFTHNIMGKKWTQYKFEHLFYFNKKNIEILANKTGFKIIYFKSALKTMTLKYMRDQFNVYKLFPITQLLNIINRIPIINKLKFKIRLGESLIILKKI